MTRILPFRPPGRPTCAVCGGPRDEGLSLDEFFVRAALVRAGGATKKGTLLALSTCGDGWHALTIAEISRLASCSPRTAQRSLRALAAAGIVDVAVQPGGAPSCYRVNVPCAACAGRLLEAERLLEETEGRE